MGKDKKPSTAETATAVRRDLAVKRIEEAYDDEHARVAKLAEGIPAHEYRESYTGMYCGAMVMRDGGGDDCGLPYKHSLHIEPRPAAEAPGPLAEIREKTFDHEVDLPGEVSIAIALEGAVTALYARVKAAKFTPADATLKVDVGPPVKRPGSTVPARARITASVRAWKAEAL